MIKTNLKTGTLVIAVGVLLLAVACGNNSVDDNNVDTTGGQSSDSTSSGGSSNGGQTSDGGESASGGSSGGTEGNGTGGKFGIGGDSSSGGQATGGAVGDQPIGTLGEPCSSPGVFACADVNPKLALLCGSDKRWEARETCDGDELCDSNEGPALGTCRSQLPECQAGTAKFCDGDALVVECAEGGFDTQVVEECGSGFGCRDGFCVGVDDPCPEDAVRIENCTDEACGTKSPPRCFSSLDCDYVHAGVSVYPTGQVAFRLPFEDLCSSSCGHARYAVTFSSVEGMAAKVTVGPGWGMSTVGPSACDDIVEKCIVLPPNQVDESWILYLTLLAQHAVTRNLMVEAVPPGTTCD